MDEVSVCCVWGGACVRVCVRACVRARFCVCVGGDFSVCQYRLRIVSMALIIFSCFVLF